ncbi:MAG: SPFH domain-containing protein, partial [Lachnospiraceae bacterium]|nr:SPFH domain-containing protein [Lachnospiraceae bacterium]
NTFKTIGKRFAYGGDTGKDQRVYYFNTKEILDNKFGTPNPVPFRVVDSKIGLDVDVSLRCAGVYSYRIADPLLFYTNVCGNVTGEYRRSELDNMLKTEFISALQPALAKLSDMELRPNQIIAHNTDLEEAMNDVLSAKWGSFRGLNVVNVALGTVTLPDEDAEMIKIAQRNAMYRDPTMGAAATIGAQAEAVVAAAKNPNGAAAGLMGVGLVNGMGGGANTAANLYAMGAQQQQQQAQAPAQNGWTCPTCGATATGNFCTNCGAKKPAPAGTWTCPQCGTEVNGNFCTNCGTKKPEAKKAICGSCGYQAPEGESPKFCPQCGKPMA